MTATRDTLAIIGRDRPLFAQDVAAAEAELRSRVRAGSFLVIGGAGSVGQAVTREIFRRDPARLHVVDLSENNLVELVRSIRSSFGYIRGDFRALPLDCGSVEFEAYLESAGAFDYVLNLSALKHVRSEKDPFTLMRMLAVNVLNTCSTLRYAAEARCTKYFAVSTDKAVKAASVMGATKRVMELCLMRAGEDTPVSTARFANVAFSDGSLLHGFTQRIQKRQPLAAPRGIARYFITPRESGELCLMGCLLGGNRDIFIPKPDGRLRLLDFPTIAANYLHQLQYTPYECDSEDEARERVEELARKGQWPCWFFESDTSGEKEVEEFFSQGEELDLERFLEIAVVRGAATWDGERLDGFIAAVQRLRGSGRWTKDQLVGLLADLLPDFRHIERNRNLDSRM